MINALTLQTTPDRCRTEVITLVLKSNFILKKKSSSDNPAQFFTVKKAFVSSLSETRQLAAEKLGPGQDVIFTQILAQSEDIRDKGGIGMGLMMIMVPEAGIAHMTPFGMPESFTEADVRPNADWETNLKDMVERGITI